MKIDAIYCRQSVERTDSISIESQLEWCQYETKGHPSQPYIDRGYSGKSTQRPAFESMMQDIQKGKIGRVIVYKLDRISRSILDFANMMELFQKYQVEFISSTERFDTSTPIGRAMLNICIVFAQLERETIQKRVSDSYTARSKRGFYMGGRIPYGFQKEETAMHGVHTSKYTPVPKEAEQIKLIFALYSDYRNSLRDVVEFLNQHQMTHLRGSQWSSSKISSLIQNPIYVKADPDVYAFFSSMGVHIENPVTDFDGLHGCYLYTRKESHNKKELVIAPHEGLIPSEQWLRCRARSRSNRQSTRTCRSKLSWLSGKVKCGICGGGLTIVTAHTHWKRYFVCVASLSSHKEKCPGTGTTVYADLLEEHIFLSIHKKLSCIHGLEPGLLPSPAYWECKRRLIDLDKKTEELTKRLLQTEEDILPHLKPAFDQLEHEREMIRKEIRQIRLREQKDSVIIKNHVNLWETSDFQGKQSICDCMIHVITVCNHKVEVHWNI